MPKSIQPNLRPDLTDKQFIEDPNEWPKWPVCPLKRNVVVNGFAQYQGGFLFAMQDKQRYPNEKIMPRVLLGNIYAIREVMEGAKSNAEFYTRYKTLDYESIDAMLADGWIVD
jgi:hypothetical protein